MAETTTNSLVLAGEKTFDTKESSYKNDPAGTASATGHNSPFKFTAEQLKLLIDPKNKKYLDETIGGVEGLCKGLAVDPAQGLRTDESFGDPAIVPPGNTMISTSLASLQKRNGNNLIVSNRQFIERSAQFGRNVLPEAKAKSILELMWDAMHDKTLIILSVAALASLAIGIYQSVDHGGGIEWVEGVAIIVAVLIVVTVQSVNDFQKEKQFRKLNSKKEDRKVKVFRDGEVKQVGILEIQVGDVMTLEPGDIVNVDGVIISAHNLKCDESAATGESDLINKQAYSPDDSCKDPFVISGSKVSEGVGRFVVTAVGVNSFFGKTLMGLRTETEDTPLQVKLDGLAENIAKLGSSVALLLLIVLLLKFIVVNSMNGWPSADIIVNQIVQIIIQTVIIIVVAVPEGLPLAVTLALAYATSRMIRDNNLVRVLASCETMGGATTVCSDKTGTLTQNKMTVVAGIVGRRYEFQENTGIQKLKEALHVDSSKNAIDPKFSPNHQLSQISPNQFLYLILEGIALNSTAFEDKDEKGNVVFIGSKTETALLDWAKKLGLHDFLSVRADNEKNTVQVYPFSSERKSMSVVLRKVSTDGIVSFRVYTKGASEIVLKYCDSYFDYENQFAIKPFSDSSRKQATDEIFKFADQALRTISLAYRDFSLEDFQKITGLTNGTSDLSEEATKNLEKHFQSHLCLLAIVGIEDPLREGVTEAVQKCQKAGVFVRMVTGDNLRTAKSIASKCGIYMKGGIIMEGPRFRKLNDSEMEAMIPRLQVLARSSPTDKQILVRKLKEMGETVAVTGDGTNDGPALKMADVGFSMGIAGTEVAKEASSIILMDDNFSSIVKAMMWGRSISDSVKKFLQFQLTVNISAVLIAFISSVSSSNNDSVLTAVQLLWINLIMDTLAALALATDPPTEELIQRQPESKRSPLITISMWKMIIGQAIYQVIAGLCIFYLGKYLIRNDDPSLTERISSYTASGVPSTDAYNFAMTDIVRTFTFNVFVLLQLFNQINCRRLDNKLNIFSGIPKNNFLMVIGVLTIAAQVIIVQFGGVVFSCFGLSGPLWGYSLLISFLTWPIGVVIRLIPTWDGCTWCGVPIAVPDHDRVFMSKERLQWQHTIQQVQTSISVFRALRGTRRHLNSSNSNSFQEMDFFTSSTGALSSTPKTRSNIGSSDTSLERIARVDTIDETQRMLLK